MPDAGVETLSNILDEEGKFLSFASFSKKSNVKTNSLHYIGLCNAIPKQWNSKEAVRSKRENESLPPGELVHKTPLNGKQVRTFMFLKLLKDLHRRLDS